MLDSIQLPFTVAELQNIVGVLGNFLCFVEFDHFYAGNLDPGDDRLELSLKYLPEDLQYSDLRDDWTLEGSGSLGYVKDEDEPEWKGTVSLRPDAFGSVDFTTKWGPKQVEKSFTKFVVKTLIIDGYPELWVLEDKDRITTVTYQAAVLPSGLEDQYPDVQFEWEPQGKARNKVKLEFKDKKRKICKVIPAGVKKSQTSEETSDIIIKVSWKIPAGMPRPYHTASDDCQAITIRTPAKIVLDRWVDLEPDVILPNWKFFKLWYVFYDNLGDKVPAHIVAGLTIKEKWLKDVLPKFKADYSGTEILPTGEFWDKIGGAVAAREYSGIQELTCDHIKGTQTVTVNLLTYPPGEISASGVTASGY